MATTPTTSSPPPPPPPPLDHLPSPSNPGSPKPPITISPPKKPQPLPWTHQETVNLIQVYQEKWYSLKRGQLKAGQWEEVAVNVAARCGYDDPSKSATQCRHKIEKLRKRYRSEKQKNPNPDTNPWQYFDLMDSMERGPLPISARPLSMVHYQNSNSSDDDDGDGDGDGDGDEEHEEDDEGVDVRSKSINHILQNPHVNARKRSYVVERKLSASGGGGGGVSRVSPNPAMKKRKERSESEDDDEEEDEGGEGEVVAELAAEIRAFAERFVRMESRKVEIMKETERFRMEMENKRMEMILESHRKIVDTIGRAFGSQQS